MELNLQNPPQPHDTLQPPDLGMTQQQQQGRGKTRVSLRDARAKCHCKEPTHLLSQQIPYSITYPVRQRKLSSRQ